VSVPVIIIGGFLGAGKTTLLNYILSGDHGVRAGVLVNDFGAIDIDARMVVGVDGETISLANGCICCTIRDDLVTACLKLLQRPRPPELVIIETSGVSDPVLVANTFLMPELRPVLSLGCILAVVDAERLTALRGEPAVLARRQILAADLVVLNKTDLVDGEELAGVKTHLHGLVPLARILETSRGRIPLELLPGVGKDADMVHRTGIPEGPLGQARDHPFTTWHWTNDSPLSLFRLREVCAGLPNTVYRAKGIVCLEEMPGYQVFLQMVGGRCGLEGGERWGPEPPRSEIVMIAARGGIEPEKLQSAFDGCVGNGNRAPV